MILMYASCFVAVVGLLCERATVKGIKNTATSGRDRRNEGIILENQIDLHSKKENEGRGAVAFFQFVFAF